MSFVRVASSVGCVGYGVGDCRRWISGKEIAADLDRPGNVSERSFGNRLQLLKNPKPTGHRKPSAAGRDRGKHAMDGV
ncbi:hypothetical protein, partial [Luteimonas kalidii]